MGTDIWRQGLSGNKWSCHEHRVSWDGLSAYLDGELEPRETERVERHLAICSDCRCELSKLRQTQLILRGVPVQPLPCSFVLPRSVAVDRRRANPWNTGFVFLRGAAVALSLLLALALSGNALLSTGALKLAAVPMTELASAPAPAAAEPELLAAPPQEAPAAAAPPAQAPAALAATAPQPNAEAALRAMAAQQAAADQQSADPQSAAVAQGEALQGEDANSEGDAEQGKASPADQRGPLTALAAAPRPPPLPGEALQPDARAGMGGGEPSFGGDSADPVSVAPLAVPDTSAPDAAALPTATAEPQAQPTPTTAPTMTPSVEAPAEPLAAAPTATPAALAAALPTQVAPARDVAPHVEEVATRPPARANGAALQAVLRTGTGVLAGLLLMVTGGLLWAGHKRRQ